LLIIALGNYLFYITTHESIASLYIIDEDGEEQLVALGNEKTLHAFRSAVNLVMWLKMIPFFRLLKSTRILIFILMRTVTDM
jgi:hypothetical protein